MNTDSFFTIGCTHTICEDYAYSNNRNEQGIKGNPFAVVCDGCSSADHSDFGARLLARSSLPYLTRQIPFSPSELLHGVISSSAAIGRSLNLHPDSLAATLLAAKVSLDHLQIFRFGDGVVAMRYTDGKLVIRDIQFITPGRPSGAPYYPRYELDLELKARYFSEFGKQVKETIYEIIDGELTREEEFVTDYDPYLTNHITMSYDNLDFVALMSDGVGSFSRLVETATGRMNEPVNVVPVVQELVDFKGLKGRFVQRRGNKAFKKFAKQGWKNADDVSLAVIAFGD